MSHYLVNQFIHVMWSTKNQQYLIPSLLKNELYAYITAIVKSKNGRIFAIGGPADHIHFLLLLPPDQSLSSLLGHVKASSSKWIKYKNNVDPQFSWQDGYLAVSTQKDRLNSVCSFIKSDEMNHQSKSYPEQLMEFLKKLNIAYNEQYYLENSHSQLIVHAIWSTNKRIPYLDKTIRYNLHEPIKEAILGCRGKVYAIGGIEDHIHILMEVPKNKSLSDLIQLIKTTATHWLKEKYKHKMHDFEWQTGYGAYTISYANIGNIKNYIEMQEEHHLNQSSQVEWDEFLKGGYKLSMAVS